MPAISLQRIVCLIVWIQSFSQSSALDNKHNNINNNHEPEDEPQQLPIIDSALNTEKSEQRRQKQSLLDWLRSRGGYFSDKISFEAPGNPDPDIGGIYALQDIQKNELVISVPEECTFKSPKYPGEPMGKSICRTAQELVKTYREKDVSSEFWPYAQYCFESFPFHQLPPSWSNAGISLVKNIVGINMLAPENFGNFTPCYKEFPPKDGRELDIVSKAYLNAALLIVQARGWYNVLAPVLDWSNHRNGHWHNIDQEFDSLTQDSFRIVALRDIRAGEQLYLSYNECHDYTCAGMNETFNTPYIFAKYGFVEQYPQRWPFYDGEEEHEKLLFDLDQGEGETDLQVNWISDPPDQEQLHWLEMNLQRLKGMKGFVSHFAKNLEYAHEANAATFFYKSLVTALEHGIASASSTESCSSST